MSFLETKNLFFKEVGQLLGFKKLVSHNCTLNKLVVHAITRVANCFFKHSAMQHYAKLNVYKITTLKTQLVLHITSDGSHRFIGAFGLF